MAPRKTTPAPAAPAGLTFQRTTTDTDVFKAKRAGGERGSRYTIVPELQDALTWTTEADSNVLTMNLASFPPARTRAGKGQPMVEGPATVDSARAYLDLHAEPLGLGVKVRVSPDDDQVVLVKAGKRTKRPRKDAA